MQDEIFVSNPYGGVWVNIHVLVDAFLKKVQLIRCHEIYYQYAPERGIWEQKSNVEILRGIANFCNSLHQHSWVRKIKESVWEEISINIKDVEEMNPYPYMLCMQNGVLNFLTGKLSKHSPKWLFTTCLDYPYIPTMPTPVFSQFISEVSNFRKSRERALLELMGYVLTFDISAEKMVMLEGNGANGKSTYIKLIEKLVGASSWCSMSVKDLESDFCRARIVDKKILTFSDLSKKDSKLLSSGEVKRIVSGDSVSANYKYGNIFSFRPKAKIILSSNHRISFSEDSTYGAIRRLNVIPFKFKVNKKNIKHNLEQQLIAELPGVIEKARKAYLSFRKRGYHFANEIESEKILRNILREEYPLRCFVEEKIISSKNSVVTNADLKTEYDAWCKQNKIQSATPTPQGIFNEISKHFTVEHYKSGNIRGIKHIAIKK